MGSIFLYQNSIQIKKNVGATFQRAINHAFKYFVGKFMVDYQDELTIKRDTPHTS
jgi:hypothetical protein